ncbi:hypothetical protein RJF2_12670 [Klebsiella pneumoniae subsp. pneumoniae]|nr:hypothetical protein RJF2_12670 [Klebsiella pneumoniae subsp. pneumoniae]
MSAINEKAVNGTQLQRTHKKIYRHLMPLLIVAYIISFIDRTNIGMAKATMSVDIGLSATAFGLGAGLFFLTYAVLEIPSNLFLTRIGARRWIARIMITWGILSCGMAFVTGPTSFYVMRLLLGAAEAGLYPGIIYYLTLWFGREERAKATGLFLLGVCLANIIGAPLGGLLLSLDGMSGWHGWQWMFFIEGLPAIALAFVVWRRLPDKPADARWLDSDDVQAINAVLAKEAEETRDTPSRFSLKTALSTRVFLLLVLIYFTHQFSVYGLSYFLPGIIGSWGQLTPLQVGLLTAIPWIAAAAGGILLPRFARTEQRSRSMLMAGYLVMATGMAIGAIAGHGVALLGFSLAAFMFFAMQSIIFNWLPSIMSGHMLAGSFGLLNCLGLCGGFLGPFILGAFEDRTGAATSGLWFAVALLIIGAVVALQNGVHLLDFASGELTLLHHPEADRPFNRLNDGKVDRQGRFLFGSMDMREEEPSGALYRLDPDLSLHVLKKDIIVSNAPCWSPSGETFYFADTWTGEICAWDYNTATGDLSGERVFCHVDRSEGGAADGATVDSEGYLWNALVYAGKLVRYTPEGKVDRIIEMPVKKVTSVMFGGENLDVLYVTSMAQPPLPRFPEDNQLRGSLFAIYDLGVTGVAERRFAG